MEQSGESALQAAFAAPLHDLAVRENDAVEIPGEYAAQRLADKSAIAQ
jgi:hypothetical protein